MKKIRVAINGFGRIGRCFTRRVLEDYTHQIEIVAINDLGHIEAMSHLLKYDSVQGTWSHAVDYRQNALIVNDQAIPVFHELSPSSIPWKNLEPDLILESTGKFKKVSEASAHFQSADKCLISAVASNEEVKTIVLGANENQLNASDRLISNASCTTNCAAPLVDIIDKELGIESGYITTVHSYTGDQALHDTMHKDLRRARAAALSIIPTTTGAAKAITKIFPHLKGYLGGAGIRVPVPNGSLTDVTYSVKKTATVDEINELFLNASNGSWKNYLEYTDKPLVSSDIIGNTHSCIFDSQLTSVVGNLVKVVGWYDNEMGYASRLCDLIVYWNKL
ncbi:MAG: glyceraldehyde 3-phosphate dehydrogenase [Cryomorphaceae bacterium]|jgi:glyceraldehyde 3-phosphate dehydrogenase